MVCFTQSRHPYPSHLPQITTYRCGTKLLGCRQIELLLETEMLTPEQKKYRDRANRARRELFKEKETFGAARDGSGKRYRVCVYYVMSGAPEKAVEFLQWFSEEFPDDVGEPVFLLHAALAYRRTGQQHPATRYLVDAMLSNLYLLPYLYGQPLAR